MTDLEKVIKVLNDALADESNYPYSVVRMSFEFTEMLIELLKEKQDEIYALQVELASANELAEGYAELLKEQEEREKAICKGICDFIRGACSVDTDDDKDFVCNEIQKCFTRCGRSVKWE